jgi:transketolase
MSRRTDCWSGWCNASGIGRYCNHARIAKYEVIVPADMHQANAATRAIAESGKPAYLRLGRSGVPTFTTTETPFEIGKAQVVYETESADVTIIACGSLVYEALQAAKDLEGARNSCRCD